MDSGTWHHNSQAARIAAAWGHLPRGPLTWALCEEWEDGQPRRARGKADWAPPRPAPTAVPQGGITALCQPLRGAWHISHDLSHPLGRGSWGHCPSLGRGKTQRAEWPSPSCKVSPPSRPEVPTFRHMWLRATQGWGARVILGAVRSLMCSTPWSQPPIAPEFHHTRWSQEGASEDPGHLLSPGEPGESA